MFSQEFNDLTERYNDALISAGVGCTARLAKLHRSNVIIKRHEVAGKKQLDEEIVAEYVKELGKRLDSGEICKDHANLMRREIEQFVFFMKTGSVKLPNPRLGARVVLTSIFQNITDGFMGSYVSKFGVKGEPISSNTRNDIRWVTHKYFEWLTIHGFNDLTKVGADQIQKFLLYCSETMAMGSVNNTRIYLTKLYKYLYDTKQSSSSYGALLSFKVNLETKVPKIHQADELAALLESIDCTTSSGKRAYAVMMLGIVLGLRAIDVIGLQLNDIDWVNGEIKILQAKTNSPVILPLTKDVGDALMDYILNARPKSNCEQIFLKLKAPYVELKSAVTIGEIYLSCCESAGLACSKRFHNLRRSRGTSLLVAGEPVTMVAQVLGHTKFNSTRKYISVDTEHLKLCALNFDSINPKAEVFANEQL